MNKTKILLADDHRIIINGIRAMLDEESDLAVTGEVSNGQEAVDFIQKNPTTDLILMDIRMPVKNGIEATIEIKAAFPNIKVMALTMFEDDDFINQMIKAGASGYVLKHTSKTELLTAIRKVASGELYFSQEVMRAVVNRLAGGNPGPGPASGPIPVTEAKMIIVATDEGGTAEITEREKEILTLIASQLTNQEIADRLFISPRTVHSHRRNLMQKLGVKNTAGLVRFAMESKII